KDSTAEEVDGVMAHLVDQFNPQKWAEHASESFRASTKLPEHESGSSWSGRLYELFEMSWNPQATMSFENYLNVDYKVNDKGVFSTYSLAESLSSKLWLARQAGGLDIDRGYCDIQALGCRAILPLTREQKEEERRQRRHKVSPIRGDGLGLTPERYAASDFYNISILAKKEIRFTPTEDMPGWLASVVNYIAPVMASLWLSRAVDQGAWTAIRKARKSEENADTLRARRLKWFDRVNRDGPDVSPPPPEEGRPADSVWSAEGGHS
ncbi:MAG TPA: hypothetical protein VN914_12895, partial [Polyangia bacterium]|nr:hypothetical protein [Polyangia bacterium]